MFWMKIHKLKIQVFTIWRCILQFAIQRRKRGTGNTKKDRNSCLHGNPNRFGFASKNHHKANNIQSAECFCEAGIKSNWRNFIRAHAHCLDVIFPTEQKNESRESLSGLLILPATAYIRQKQLCFMDFLGLTHTKLYYHQTKNCPNRLLVMVKLHNDTCDVVCAVPGVGNFCQLHSRSLRSIFCFQKSNSILVDKQCKPWLAIEKI